MSARFDLQTNNLKIILNWKQNDVTVIGIKYTQRHFPIHTPLSILAMFLIGISHTRLELRITPYNPNRQNSSRVITPQHPTFPLTQKNTSHVYNNCTMPARIYGDDAKGLAHLECNLHGGTDTRVIRRERERGALGFRVRCPAGAPSPSGCWPRVCAAAAICILGVGTFARNKGQRLR